MAEDNNGDWRASLPLEYRTSDSLSKFKDLGGLVKSYIDMEKFVSTTGRVPRDDSKPEDWASYYKHWGRPEKPEYKFPDLPKEYQPEDDFKGAISNMAHELGLNQKQFDKMVQWGLQQSQGIYEKNNRILNESINELKKKWGYSFDRNRERAQKTAAMLVDFKSDHPFIQWLESTGNVDNPIVLDFFYDLSKRLGEDNFVDEHVKKEASDKEEAGKKIREIMSDAKHAYFNENSPMHKDAVNEMARLYSLAYPEE
jgi:hypothetical protein